MEKIDFRTLDEKARLAFRRRAINLIEGGTKKGEVARIIGVKSSTISEWWKKYKDRGSSGLKSKKKGARSEDRKLLSLDQEKAIQKMIIDKMPDQLKFPYALWTRKAVKELVEREYGIVIAVNTMGDYLRKWGFSPQRPKKQAYERCGKQVQRWLDEEYPKIKKAAKAQNAVIHWGDETGVKNQNNHGRSYAPKGKTPVKRSMSKKFSVNMISTITNQGQVRFMMYSGGMNGQVLIKFMSRLIKTTERKIFLILDNLRVHHSRVVKEWLSQNHKKISVFYLPSYSPDLNPDEYLNCDLKYALSEKPAPRNKETLKKNIQSHMRKLQRSPSRIKKYFKHPAISYAA
jgi:transposase